MAGDDDEGIQEEPTPRRQRRREEEYDEYDEPPRRRRELSWLDQQFGNKSLVILVLFSVCCGMFAVFFAVIGVGACQDPPARRNAIIVLVISLIWIAMAVAILLVTDMMQQGHL